ncbi:MAG: ribbon-helix-helix protein, CopG family [Patescibacteria group bacterium]
MALLQIKIDDKLKKAIDKKAESYGVPSSSLVRILLVKSFTDPELEHFEPGNVFNADRDSGGKGIKIDDLISRL